ncbi:MAG: hypothetical protein ABIO70_26090, partial [Pseudomonadota bacterium]
MKASSAQARLLPLVSAKCPLTAAERRERAQARAAWLRGEEPDAGVLPERVADWPEEAREIWEERAAIIEFDGGLPREAAERLAEERVR